jgi:aerobic carbon-monoxide dehydrogenase medium subunit
MYPVDVTRPTTLQQAVTSFRASGDAMFLSGGMTLVPSMKAHLTAPQVLVDLSGVTEMHGMTDTGASLRVGALTTLATMAASGIVKTALPELARIGGMIADRHVRNRGTIGGSVANNDPAADYPAAVLGLGATLTTNRRAIDADAYFTGLFETDLEEDEILVAIDFPKPLRAAYAKYAHPVSGYAVAGVFVAQFADVWRVAVTGSGAEGVFRLTSLEQALSDHGPETALPHADFDSCALLSEPAFPEDFRRAMIRHLARDALSRCG